jgi:hypothetical protein
VPPASVILKCTCLPPQSPVTGASAGGKVAQAPRSATQQGRAHFIAIQRSTMRFVHRAASAAPIRGTPIIANRN